MDFVLIFVLLYQAEMMLYIYYGKKDHNFLSFIIIIKNDLPLRFPSILICKLKAFFQASR